MSTHSIANGQILTDRGKTALRTSNYALTQRQRKLSMSEDVITFTRDTIATSRPLLEASTQGVKGVGQRKDSEQ